MKQQAKRSPIPGVIGLLVLTGLVLIGVLFVVLPDADEGAPVASTPTGTAVDEAAYLEALAAIDPEFVDNERSAIGAGENICQEIETGKEADIVETNAAKRFDAPAAEGAAIVKAARTHLCP
ncbi:DUF732 domain-containing protein [Micromonospora andamanensis]|uniref:DUF732 domain-containing protein n=1 Tax=Micromonospora andamanensis TaxID=1287068 RepID=A0ABQ4HYJ0_9ACTN|nr:DUF732 domain-containing protein [Micromonospora andamanensis]GIJ10728.1 hypothetical protein Van01_39420 [Micromonospora andamanensis]